MRCRCLCEAGMNIGTKSVLFGAHQFLIHPWFVAAAWWKLYGFPGDPRLWAAFFLHDLGYWGKPNMDGPEGERHVEWAARLMHRLFDRPIGECRHSLDTPCRRNPNGSTCWRWHDFCLYHSRFYAKRDGRRFSRLCVADKLALALTPGWLYLPMVRWSGEIHEYMALAKKRNLAIADPTADPKYAHMNLGTDDQKVWYA